MGGKAGRRMRGLTLLPAILLAAMARGADEDEPDPPPPRSAVAAPLGRDLPYWRGVREETPGAFLALRPAASNVLVTCDRWPDASDLRQFARDAIRLADARTPEEEALAVWRWIRRFKVHTDGNAPTEYLAQQGTSYVTDPIKVLNVYGAHFCGGLSRVCELVWRANGGRADRVHCGSHSMVELFYGDRDGHERYHIFDVNYGGYEYDHSRRWIMGAEDHALDFSGSRLNWTHSEHWPWPTHRVDLALRQGEKLERRWGNWGQPYQDHMDIVRDRRRTPLAERGPYADARTYGNGRWSYRPDLANPDWQDGLAEPPHGMALGRLQPAAAGATGAAVWRFRTPYIVADASVELNLYRKSALDSIRLLLSLDEGLTWRRVWECPTETTGAARVTAAICDKYKVTAAQPPPRGFSSPFGHYAYRLKLELTAAGDPADCRVEGLLFNTVVQQNLFALPQLQPGRNTITVRGDLAPGAALRVTYLWDDAAGRDRRNVTVVEQTPYSYEIVAAGEKWEDCRSRELTVEAMPASGRGNHVQLKETPARWAPLPAPPPTIATRGRGGWLVRADPAALNPVERCIADLGDPGKRDGALKQLVEHRDPAAFEALRRIVYEERDTHHKAVALVTLYHSDRERSRAVLLDILENPGKVAWSDKPIRKGPRNADEHWAGTAALIGALAARADWSEAIPGLLKVLAHPVASQAGEARFIIMRSFAAFGDERIKPAVLASVRGRGDESSWAALAAARIGAGEALGDIRRLLADGNWVVQARAARALGQLGDGASAPALMKLLRHGDENLRAAGAAALGMLGVAEARPLLREAAAVEPFAWVRAEMETAAARLNRGEP